MKNESKYGCSFPTILFLIFLGLKLFEVIDWSWWWVTSPIWLPWAIGISLFVFALLVWLIGSVVVGIINLFT